MTAAASFGVAAAAAVVCFFAVVSACIHKLKRSEVSYLTIISN
jgi:hypothetical protein